MQTAPPLTLLRENGYKVLTAPKRGNRSRQFIVELQDKIVRVEEGDLNVTVRFANRNDGIGDLGRSFNRMVQQLRESRDEAERLHCNQLSRAQHLATVGELAAGLAHEIRNPLAGIAGVIEIIGRDLPAASPALAVVKDVRLEIAQINRILTDLLQTARPHPPEVRPSDLNTTVEHAVSLARQNVLSRQIKIELEKDPTLPNVEHDSDQIHQLFLNLLLNAVQSIEGAGAVRVEISSLKGDAAIVVIDTGRGIAPEHLPNIFRPFYTTKRSGTGLGLSLSRRIAEEHHGRIEVTSEVGKGTTFLVVLPLRQATRQAEAS
jgi:signal transduction histidine kinase